MIDAILCLAGVNYKFIMNVCTFFIAVIKIKIYKDSKCNFSKDTQDIKCIFKCWTWKTIKSHKCFSGLLLLYFPSSSSSYHKKTNKNMHLMQFLIISNRLIFNVVN